MKRKTAVATAAGTLVTLITTAILLWYYYYRSGSGTATVQHTTAPPGTATVQHTTAPPGTAAVCPQGHHLNTDNKCYPSVCYPFTCETLKPHTKVQHTTAPPKTVASKHTTAPPKTVASKHTTAPPKTVASKHTTAPSKTVASKKATARPIIVGTWMAPVYSSEQIIYAVDHGVNLISFASVLPEKFVEGKGETWMRAAMEYVGPLEHLKNAIQERPPKTYNVQYFVSIGGSRATEWECLLGNPPGGDSGKPPGNRPKGSPCTRHTCGNGLTCEYWASETKTVTGPDGNTCSYGPEAKNGCCIPIVGKPTTCISEHTGKPTNIVSIAAARIADLCSYIGLTGVGWDLEGFDSRYKNTVYQVCRLLQTKYNLSVMLTILLGDHTSWDYLISKRPACYDYVTLMLYNGGMYQGSKSEGGACPQWEGWAETFLKQCPSTNPPTCTGKTFCQKTGGAHKVLLGVITDTASTVCDTTCAQRAQALIHTYGGGGIMNWVLQGWGNNRAPGGSAKAFFCDILPAFGVNTNNCNQNNYTPYPAF